MVFGHSTGFGTLDQWTIAALTHSTIVVASAVGVWFLRRIDRVLFANPLGRSGLISSAAAAALIVAGMAFSNALPPFDTPAMRAFWVATLWLALAAINIWPALFTSFQIALALAMTLAATALLQKRQWFSASSAPFFDPWTIQVQGIALMVQCLFFTAIRLGLRRLGIARQPIADPDATVWKTAAARLLYPSWPSFDRILAYAGVGLLLVIVAPALASGFERELAAYSAGAPSIPQHTIHATGIGSWLLLGVVLVALLPGIWIELEEIALPCLFIGLLIACALVAGKWNDQTSVASAFRWLTAALLIVSSSFFWLRKSASLLSPAQRSSAHLRTFLLALTVLPILALTFYPAAQAIGGTRLVGPTENSFFHKIGQSANYLVPLLLVMAAFIGHAVTERSATWAFCAAVVLNIAVSLGYVLGIVTAGHAMGEMQWIRLVQFNALASAAFAAGWLAGLHLWRGTPAGHRQPMLLQLQLALPILALSLLILPLEFRLIIDPERTPAWAHYAADLWGWLSCICAGAVGITAIYLAERRVPPVIFFGGFFILGSLLAIGHGGSWTSYHLLLASRAGGGWFMLGLGWIASLRLGHTSEEPSGESPENLVGALSHRLGWLNPRTQITRWTLVFIVLAIALALRAVWDDPARPSWTITTLLGLAPLGVGLVLWTMRSDWLYLAGLLLNLAASIWWLIGQKLPVPSPTIGLIEVNVIVLSLSGLAFLILELSLLRPLRQQVAHRGLLAFHRFAAAASLAAMLLVIAFLLTGDVLWRGAALNPWTSSAAPAAALLVMFACLWDADARRVIFGLYLCGLIVFAAALRAFHPTITQLGWVGVVILAAYSTGFNYLYTIRHHLLRLAQMQRIPSRDAWPATSPGWLAPATIVQAIFVFGLAFFMVQHLGQQPLRLLVAVAAISMAVATGLLALQSGQFALKRTTLALGVIGAIFWGWAWLDPNAPGNLLNRLVLVMVALAAMTALYAVGLVKIFRRENEWTAAAKQLAPFVAAGTAAMLALVMSLEGVNYDPAGNIMVWWAVAAVAAALFGLLAAAIACAVIPGADPFNLSERQRTSYVYAAELLLVLIFVHLRLTTPWLFRYGLFERYWPFITLAIAFAGVGLSEVFRRQNRSVLAEPLQNSGAFLPLLPAVGFWISAKAYSGEFTHATVLFGAAGLYTALAVMRRSYGFGLLAALAANGGIWAVLARVHGLGFFDHPQLWLIPVALSVLAAAHLNRQRLTDNQTRSARYLCLMVIYVSSTADIWINGLIQAPWLPLILAMLAVCGVLAGILLRIQSFLFLGTLFLLVSIVAMIRYATIEVHSNWPWLVAGIALGAGIIVLFALFEKKRTEMLKLVDGLKEWQH